MEDDRISQMWVEQELMKACAEKDATIAELVGLVKEAYPMMAGYSTESNGDTLSFAEWFTCAEKYTKEKE